MRWWESAVQSQWTIMATQWQNLYAVITTLTSLVGCTDWFSHYRILVLVYRPVHRATRTFRKNERKHGAVPSSELTWIIACILIPYPRHDCFRITPKISRNRGRRFSTYAGKRKCQCRCCFPNSSSKIASCRSQRFGCLRYSCSIDEFSRIFVQLICYAFHHWLLQTFQAEHFWEKVGRNWTDGNLLRLWYWVYSGFPLCAV